MIGERVLAAGTSLESGQILKILLELLELKFQPKAVFESGENQFQKSIFRKCMRLAVTENIIFWKMTSY